MECSSLGFKARPCLGSNRSGDEDDDFAVLGNKFGLWIVIVTKMNVRNHLYLYLIWNYGSRITFLLLFYFIKNSDHDSPDKLF